ncbi:MAG: RluA family pseudouridine synthase [Kiritimatiellae bacterium]|nr:RluA family pseudouridine synthase [Kiritimatiellia bacterium]
MPDSAVVFVVADGAGLRLDAWLASHAPELSRARIQALIKSGDVTVDGAPVKANTKARLGSRIVVSVPPPVPAEPAPEEIPLSVVYEDSDCLVLNKPAGLVVHPAPGHSGGTLVNALLAHCRDLKGVGGVERPGIVHRLDKDTTGLMVVAKNDAAMAGLVRLFQSGGIRKEYLAWTRGVPSPERGTVNTLIGRDPRHRQRMAVVPVNGKPAVTEYRVEERCDPFALVRCRIETGRTHQIRVHMRHIGCPIVGDPVYGKPAADRQLAVVPDRQLLHAALLAFAHPVTGQPLRFEAPPPADFAAFTAYVFNTESFKRKS